MCRVCFISGAISRSGGTERVGSIIANALSKRGYDVFLLSFWNHGKPYYTLDEKIHVSYLLDPKKEGKLYRTKIYPVLKLHRFLKQNMIDVVIDIDTVLSRHTAYAIQGTKCKLISWEHFNYWTMMKLREKNRFQAKKLIRKYASALVVLTNEDLIKHNEVYHFPEGFVQTIPNPCVSHVVANYHFANHVFLSVGRLESEKGYDLLLHAWQQVEHRLPDWHLAIVGIGSEWENLLSLKQALHLERVIFTGHSDNVGEVYSQASAYVLSSRYEGFPMVILEAQSYGLPVIAFDCKTGPRDLVSHEENGYLVDDGNIEQLAEVMIQFTKDQQKAEKMSYNAAESVKKYDLESITDQWEDLIKKVIQQ